MTKVRLFYVGKVPTIKRLCGKSELNPLTPPSLCQREGGAGLPDFTRVDSFSLQVASQETPRKFGFCLSAVSLF